MSETRFAISVAPNNWSCLGICKLFEQILSFRNRVRFQCFHKTVKLNNVDSTLTDLNAGYHAVFPAQQYGKIPLSETFCLSDLFYPLYEKFRELAVESLIQALILRANVLASKMKAAKIESTKLNELTVR